MRFLFVHQNFPGQYLHLLRYLTGLRRHELMFITEANPNTIAGVRKVTYGKPPPLSDTTYPDAQEFEQALVRAQMVAQTARQLKELGFTPDIIIGHHGWGELLNIEDVWPGVPVLGYYEFFYTIYGLDVGFDPEFPTPADLLPRVRAKNAVNLLALNNPGQGQTPTRFQHETYPPWAREKIDVLSEGVWLNVCQPDPASATRPFVLNGFAVAPHEKLVTFVARDLEPYRGFHVFMRALPALLRARPDLKVVLVGADGVSYGARILNTTWREYMMGEVGHDLDADRVLFAGRIDYDDYVRMLQRSDAHVYLTYPFVASWSLREALACGCVVVGSDTAPVREFVQDGVTGLLTPFLEPGRLVEQVLRVLEDQELAMGLRAGARAYAERNLRMADHIDGFDRLITGLTGQSFNA